MAVQMDPRVHDLITRIHEDPRRALTLNGMAGSLNLSSSRLHFLFKVEMGTSPTKYIRAIRLREAKRLLESTFLSVKQIMVRVGISDGSHFTRDFKNAYGITPQQLKSTRHE